MGLRSTEPAYAALEPRDIFLEIVKHGVLMGREQSSTTSVTSTPFSRALPRNITGQWIAVDGGITLRQSG